jgi:hypothetical protein
MDFWQSVTTFSLVFGLISSLVALLGFFVDVTKLKHKHKILLISIPLALIFIGGGTVSFAYRLTSSVKENNSSRKGSTTNTTTPTSVPPTGSAFQPVTSVTSSATATTTITPTSTASTNISPKNQTLPLAIPCVSGSCSSFPFTLTLNSITSDRISGETDWVFTLENASGSNCGSVGFSPVPTLGSAQAQGQTTGWAMSQRQQLPVTMIFPQSQTGVPYDLNVKLAFQKCVSSSGGHNSGSDTYQTEAFVF